MLVCVEESEGEGLVLGVLAMSLDQACRQCIVQTIHVSPAMRGPLQLPKRMWQYALHAVTEAATAVRSKEVRFVLETACCQSQQGAHFWIMRMGWDGSEDAMRAATAWGKGSKWNVGHYSMWYILRV